MKTIKKGDILASQWGYEQTNVCFYEVVKATKCFVTVREVSSLCKQTGWAQELKTPCRASYIGEPVRRKVKDFSIAKDRPFIEVTDYENAYLWDGRPMEETSYY